MTREEAINWMKLACLPYHNYDARVEAINMAIADMEKQIPKKVIFEDDGEELLCPNCGFDFMGAFDEPDHDPYYCFECGQALDWSVEND